MSYEVLVLRNEWLFSDRSTEKYQVLTDVINKAYNRPAEKYGIITTPRIKDADSFIDNLQLHDDQNNFIAILLGSENVFKRIESESGYRRDFTIDPFLPRELAAHFEKLDSHSNIEVTVAPADFEVGSSVANRVLATVGFKGIGKASKPIGELEYEMTAFTSFLYKIAPQFMELVFRNFLKMLGFPIHFTPQPSGILVHAVVIRDHELVPYYTKFCGFSRSSRPDLLVSAADMDSPFDDDCMASRDFHLTFLYRKLRI